MIYTHDREELQREPYTGVITDGPPIAVPDSDIAWDSMNTYLQARGLSPANATRNGCYPINRKGLRMYIPAETELKGHHYWQARSLEGHELRYDSPFGPRRDAIIVMSGHRGIRPLTKIAIVEGPLDALAVAEYPEWIGIGLMGATPSEEALNHVAHRLRLYQPQVLRCIADRDSVGAMAKIQGWLAMRGYPSELRIPQGFKDICEGTGPQRTELLYGH